MDNNIIYIKKSKFWLNDDGIVISVQTKNTYFELDDAKESINVMKKLGSGTTQPLLLDIRGSKGASPIARKYIAGKEGAKVFKAMALVIDSPLSRIIGNFFIFYSKPLYPTRLFNQKKEAMAWLEQYKTAHNVVNEELLQNRQY